MAAIKLHMKTLQEYMRWPPIGSVYADDSWNSGKLQGFADEAYKIGKSIK